MSTTPTPGTVCITHGCTDTATDTVDMPIARGGTRPVPVCSVHRDAMESLARYLTDWESTPAPVWTYRAVGAGYGIFDPTDTLVMLAYTEDAARSFVNRENGNDHR